MLLEADHFSQNLAFVQLLSLGGGRKWRVLLLAENKAKYLDPSKGGEQLKNMALSLFEKVTPSI